MQMSRQMTRIANGLDFLDISLKREFKEVGQNSNTSTVPKCYGCQGYRDMKLECLTYLKSIGKSKTLVATLSVTEPKADLEDSDQEGIVSIFTTTIDSSKEFEEDLIESKFEETDEKDVIHTIYSKLYKNFEKHEKLYRLATRKLSE